MPSTRNIELLKTIEAYLSEKPNFIVTTYSGLSVEEMTMLRKKLKEKNVIFKVVKNNLFKLALKNSKKHNLENLSQIKEMFYGPIALTFSDSEISVVAKLLLEESKKNEKIKIKGGYYEGKFLTEVDVKAISTLPTKEELLTIIARGLQSPTQKIAVGLKEVITKLARGLKAVAEKKSQS